jgi:hypothetical protein
VNDDDKRQYSNLYVNLREHFEMMLTERERLSTYKFQSFEDMFKQKNIDLDQSITLAREQIRREKENATAALDIRLESMNEFRAQMNKAEAAYATKTELRAVERLVYIGVGIILTFEILTRFLKF